MTNVARPLRGLVYAVVAFAATAGAALPATAAIAAGNPQIITKAGEWWLTALHVPAASQAAPTAGKGVTVAVLSTGVDTSNPDLVGTVTAGPDFSGTGRKPRSSFWGIEGTAVASLIAGHGHGPDGTEGITGVAPKARIVSVQVTLEYDDPLASDATITRRLPDAIASGIRWAVGHGATVIALPLDPSRLETAAHGNQAASGSAAEKAAVGFALAHNVLLVAPAGDNGAKGNATNYPAAYPGVIAVGATTRAGQFSPFSNTGSYVALTAPGAGTTPNPPVGAGTMADPAAGLTVATPGGGYQSLASSDMSAALTAGVAALIRSRYPSLSVPEVTKALENGVTAPAGSAGPAGTEREHGELDAALALSSAAAIAAAHPAPASTMAPASHPARAAGTRQAASGPDPAHALRSLAVDLSAAAGALIVCLVVAMALTQFRRRARTDRRPSHARHAKNQLPPATAPSPARVAVWPTAPATPPKASDVGGAWLRMTDGSSQVPGTFGKPSTSSGAHRVPEPTGNPPWQPAVPPWQPADPPGDPASAPALLSAPTMADEPSQALAPWERSPEEFAVAPPLDASAPWPVSSTGPMYVWNPATATGPMIAINDDEAKNG